MAVASAQKLAWEKNELPRLIEQIKEKCNQHAVPYRNVITGCGEGWYRVKLNSDEERARQVEMLRMRRKPRNKNPRLSEDYF